MRIFDRINLNSALTRFQQRKNNNILYTLQSSAQSRGHAKISIDSADDLSSLFNSIFFFILLFTKMTRDRISVDILFSNVKLVILKMRLHRMHYANRCCQQRHQFAILKFLFRFGFIHQPVTSERRLSR